MKPPAAGGGWPAIWYTIRKARASGGLFRMWRALRSRNACKTCALGMGGQRGGMVNEQGRFPEVCKKSVQAMAADMQGRIREGFFDEFGFDKLERFSPRELEHSGRLVEPLIAEGGAGDKSYRPISWDEAIGRVAGAMGELRDRGGAALESYFYFSGRSSNEAAFLLQLVARLYGTNNVNNCSFFCHQASGVGLRSVTGSGTATVTLEDIAEDRGGGGCDLLFIIGGNPASNHPRLMRTIIDIKRRGGKVVVINPLKELGLVRFKVPSDVRSMLARGGSEIADVYVQPHIGGDIGLMAGVVKALLAHETLNPENAENAEGNAEAAEESVEQPGDSTVPSASTAASSAWSPSKPTIDRTFIRDHTEGFDEFKAGIDSLSWQRIEASAGIGREEIESLARVYAESKKAVFCWTMGVTHHVHGVSNVRMIAAAAMVRGMLGKPGAGLLPLRGHSNVQGVGSMLVEPRLKREALAAMQDRFGVELPKSPGMDTLQCVEAAARGAIRFGWHLGGNLYGSCPDAAFATRALRSIDTTVFLSTTLNTGHIHGRGKTSIILPVLARDEEPQATTQESMFNYVRLSDGGRSRYTGPQGRPLSEVEVVCRVFRRVLGDRVGGLDLAEMEEHANIRQAIAAVVPGYGELKGMDSPSQKEGAGGRAGLRSSPAGGEFQIPGRTFRTPEFNTASGKAKFYPVPSLPDPPRVEAGELRLMTIRSEGQFNTVVYEEEDFYRGQERRDVILMAAADMTRLGLKRDDRVNVSSEAGEMRDVLVREGPIRAGNAAMYYPEANALVPRRSDAESRTPAFKSVAVRVARAGRLVVLK